MMLLPDPLPPMVKSPPSMPVMVPRSSEALVLPVFPKVTGPSPSDPAPPGTTEPPSICSPPAKVLLG